MIDATFYKTLCYRATARPAELLADMDQLDVLSEKARKRRNAWAIGCAPFFLMLVVPFVMLFVLKQKEWFGTLFGVIAAGVVGAVVCGAFFAKASRLMLDKRRRETARDVVRHLACDLDPAAEATVAIDFNAYQQKRYRKHTGKAGFYVLNIYELPWLLIEGAFLDGNQFRMETTLLVKRKERAKRKYSKVKELLWENFALSFKIKNEKADALSFWAKYIRSAPLPEGVSLKKTKVEGQRLVLQAQSKQQLRAKDRSGTTNRNAETLLSDVHVHLKLCLACYQALNQCRAHRGSSEAEA